MPKSNIFEVLKTQFGLPSFRPGQYESIEALLEYRRLLCIQPTGHGKSLIYQLTSVLLDGITVVISPLLALMRDQIWQLNNRFNISAASINSDQTEAENALAKAMLLKKQIKILFISPEQLGDLDRFEFLSGLDVSLIVVDEAHCVSKWGHDFRPEYRHIINLVLEINQKNKALRVLGLTATADNKTEEDIVAQLSEATQPVLVNRQSMNRPNIALASVLVNQSMEKLAVCEQLVLKFMDNQSTGTGLIYCATRENTEMLSDYLKWIGIRAEYYHAGLEPDKKRSLQQAFIEDKYEVLVATNSLGMGIDKSNIRFVIHFDFPGSVTSYYQEVGRAGRDGEQAYGILIFCEKDKAIQDHFIQSAFPSPENVKKILSTIREEKTNISQLKVKAGLHPTVVTAVVSELVQRGCVEKIRLGGKQVYSIINHHATPDMSRYESVLHEKIGELNKIIHYATQETTCRMNYLRLELGDKDTVQECSHCDVCKKENYQITNVRSLNAVSNWLENRIKSIHLSKQAGILEGFSLLDGSLKTIKFIQFMKSRVSAELTVYQPVLCEILNELDMKIKSIQKETVISAILVLPSRTWLHRIWVSKQLEARLGIPILTEALYWKNPPDKKQGELLNNDQRRENVHGKMGCRKLPVLDKNLLLLDDYMGSGATLKESIRALREAHIPNPVMPVTLACVKWRLGRSGMI